MLVLLLHGGGSPTHLKLSLPGARADWGCCRQSIYYKYPECCGANVESAYCCGRTAGSAKCLQFEDNFKVWNREVSAKRCLDYTGEKDPCGDSTVFTESACQMVAMCCIVGASEDECYFFKCAEGTPSGAFNGSGSFLSSFQQLCIQGQCQIPPGDVVPFGIGCCGE